MKKSGGLKTAELKDGLDLCQLLKWDRKPWKWHRKPIIILCSNKGLNNYIVNCGQNEFSEGKDAGVTRMKSCN